VGKLGDTLAPSDAKVLNNNPTKHGIRGIRRNLFLPICSFFKYGENGMIPLYVILYLLLQILVTIILAFVIVALKLAIDLVKIKREQERKKKEEQEKAFLHT
jgi:uncharacterized membrane protein